MDEKKVKNMVSKTGATIELVTNSGKGRNQKMMIGECRPENDPYSEPECAPSYHCAPDEEPRTKSRRPGDQVVEDDCQDYGCCPKKPAQDCEPNV